MYFSEVYLQKLCFGTCHNYYYLEIKKLSYFTLKHLQPLFRVFAINTINVFTSKIDILILI